MLIPFRILFQKVIFLFVLLGSVVCCKQEVKENLPIESTALFKAVPKTTSGVDFVNAISDTHRQNIIKYPYYYNGGGVAIGDLNNDSLPDLYFTGNMSGDGLFLNKGNLTFEDATRKSGILKSNLWTTGVTFADVNNDGWTDIYVCRSGMGSYRNNLLYINQKNGKFKEEGKSFGLNDEGFSVQSYFFDYDLDGNLDMYLVNHSNRFFASQEELFSLKNNPSSDEADKLYRNKGDGTFEEVSKEAGISHFGFGLSAAVGDVNQDGYPDIYVANDFFEPDFLYLNNGDGTFKNVLQEKIGHTSFSSMGSDMADFNNDGLPDIVVCDMQASDNFRKKANMASMDVDRFARIIDEGYHYQYMQNTLQLNTGDGRFSEIAELAEVSETDWSWGPLFVDMDNDGHKDLFVSNGIRRDVQYKDILNDLKKKNLNASNASMLDIIDNFPVQKLKNFSFRNKGNFRFSDVSETWGIDFEGFSTGAAYSDLDLDGDMDLVLNNIDDDASIYQNLSSDSPGAKKHLQIVLKGMEDNYQGIGSTVKVTTKDSDQFQYIMTSRGFQSSVEPIAHFGIDSALQIEKVTVSWPNGTKSILKDVKVDQRLVISQTSARKISEDSSTISPLFQEINQNIRPNFRHKEQPFNDFKDEILLPHKYSQLGPCIVAGDVNADGLDDFYVGGAKGQAGKLYLQNSRGSFRPAASNPWSRDQDLEDTGGLFFDCDGDGDQDLYVISGSNEWRKDPSKYQDRLYINNGSGQFKSSQLPDLGTSGGTVKAGDFDADGDLDLFVGGRLTPGKYPMPANSAILSNDGNGNFTNITATLAKDLLQIGMVTDAQWTDFDTDGDLDIMVVGEWMPITLLENQNGKFVRFATPSFEKTEGWWYSMAQADFDNDGDNDYVFGNLGLNYKYKATKEEPFQVYANDFDDNGTLDIVLGYFEKGELFPVRGKQCSTQQMPYLENKFPNFASFASSNLEDVYGKENLQQALHYNAYTFASVYVENLGGGKFSIRPLPIEAQFSAVNAFAIDDFNGDEHLDILLAGNMYNSEVETARNDAGFGLALLGDGQGNFSHMSAAQSGFLAYGDVKSVVQLKGQENKSFFIVGNNNNELQLFELNKK